MNWLQQRKFQILADQAVFSGTGFLLTVLLARHLDAPDFGYYSACVLASYLAVSASNAWSISVFQVAKEKTLHYVSFVFWWQILIVIAGLAFAVSIHHIYTLYASCAPLLFVAGFVLHDFGRKLLLSLQKTLEALILDSITALLLIASFVFIQKTGSKELNTLLGFFAAVYFVSIVITLFFSQAFSLQTKGIKVLAGQHLRTGKWLFFTAISQWWAGNLLVVASGIYLGSTALGALRLAQSLFGVLNVLLQTFEHYVLPQTVQHLNKSLSGGLHYLKYTNQKLGLAFIPTLLATFVFAESILAFAGGELYAPYAFVLRGLCILYVLVFLSQPIRFLVRALQLNRYFFYGYVLNLGFALATSQWLLFHFGLHGVIAGLIAAQTVLMLYWTLILHQQKNINVWKSFISY